jgi:tetratricopeptide (TPR) repeat protein
MSAEQPGRTASVNSMFSQTKFNLRRHLKLLVLSLVIFAVSGSTQTAVLLGLPPAATLIEQDSGSEALNKLKIASMQHDLILLLIESGNFDRVESEWRKVLDLKLGQKYEGAIAQSLLIICYKLSEANQLSLAQSIMDESLSAVAFSNKSAADIFRLKAYVYKEAGDLDSAIDALRKASELAEKP